MSGLIETDPEKIAKKERKEDIKRIAMMLGFGIGIVGLMYSLRPDYRKQELQDNYTYCNDLLQNASGNNEITDFVYNQVRIREGIYRGQPCHQIIDEYTHRKE